MKFLTTGLLGFALVVCATTSHATDVVTRTVNSGNVVLENVPEVPKALSHQLSRYLHTRGASFQAWTGDGIGIYITTRFGEVSQIHRVDMPGGARQQLTFFEEPIGSVRPRPHHDALSFTMDAGGNEQAQIFLLDAGSGQHHMISDGEARNGEMEWSDDGSLLAFYSTRRDGRSNDVWVMDPDDVDSARIVLEAAEGGAWWGPEDWSADLRHLLIAEYVSITNSRIYLLELDSGELTLLAGDRANPTSVLGVDPQFGPNDEGVFYSSDESGEFQQLTYLDLASGQRTVITEDIPWDVSGLQLNDAGDRAVFIVNEGGVDRVWLLDTETFAKQRIETVPTGRVGGLSFHPDDRFLSMTLSTARTPSDVFTLELGEGPLDYVDLIRWTFSEVGGLDTDTFSQPELIDYPTFDDRRIPAFVYRPNGDGPHPIVIYIHGGPEAQFKPRFSATFQSWIDVLGVAVIAPNVRGSSGYGKDYVTLDNGYLREDSVKDIGALLDWIETQPDLDADRVAVYGARYGGYMVLSSLMHYSDRLRAGVDLVGISNFVTFLENTQDYRRDRRRAEYGDERDPNMRAHLESISPSNSPERITAPLFVAQGQNDPRVPVTESEQIVAAVRKAGYDVWYMNALNEGHGFRKKENADFVSRDRRDVSASTPDR